MTLDDVYALKQVSDPQISPNGRWVAYVVAAADFERGRWDSDLWIVDTAAGAPPPRQLTFNIGRDNSPRWSPDSQRIAFLRARPEGGHSTAQIYVLTQGGGEAVKLTNEPLGVNLFQWSPDGASIFYVAAERTAPAREARRAEPYFEDEDRPRARVWRIGVGQPSGCPPESAQAKACATRSRIETGDWHVEEIAVSPDGKWLAYSAAPTAYFNDGPKSELFLLPLVEGKAQARRLTNNTLIGEGDISWRPDSTSFIFLAGADASLTKRAFESRAFVARLSDGKVAPLAAEPDSRLNQEFRGSVAQAIWRGQNTVLLSVANGPHQEIFQLNVNGGTPIARTTQNSVNSSVSSAADLNVAVYIRQEPYRPAEVWLLGPSPQGDRALTAHNSAATELLLPRAELVHWKASDDVEVEGILLTPQDSAAGKGPWPLVTSIHGGPASAEMASFRGFANVLTGMGIAVFLPNYRGSTNYGEEFAARSVGDRNGRDARDIEEGIDALIARGIADPKRLAVMGWSAGGVLTNWLIANNTRYRAAITGAGVSDWRMQYFLSDYTYGSDLYFKGTPWQQNELYWERSPLRLAAQVKTPTLIHCGERDERVPIHHARAWFRALREHGVTTRFMVYPGEPHSFQDPRNQRRRDEENIAWLRKYLLTP